jgi:hypothetical protein
VLSGGTFAQTENDFNLYFIISIFAPFLSRLSSERKAVAQAVRALDSYRPKADSGSTKNGGVAQAVRAQDS